MAPKHVYQYSHARKKKASKNKNKRKTPKESWGSRFWFGFLKALGFVVLLGMILLYGDSARLTSIILNATPVDQLTDETTGMVKLEGQAEGTAAFTDEGKLRAHFALIQKETFYWQCSKSGCSYKRNEDRKPEVSGLMGVNGAIVESDWFRFYSDWLPLNASTVDADEVPNIYEGDSSRPLLVESPKEKAYGYYAVSPGDHVAVIALARDGRLEPFALPGEDEKRVILIGTSVERMVSEERKSQIVYLIIGAVVALMLLPTVIRWIRGLYRKIHGVVHR
ncbi:hypothetical protein NYE48_14985 [Paenibacillus sp. FSL M7-1455]|uniref:hypothetical protein n=1 Tax=Paenibacillus sp. FSL M7-1455 TaxID=2975316 RepID=UPI0030F5DB61